MRLGRHRFDPWVGKIPGEGNGNPLQYSCLENSMDRGTWRAEICGVSKNWTQLKYWACTVMNLAKPPVSCRPSQTQLLPPQLTPKQGHHKQGHCSPQFFMAPSPNLRNRHIWLCRQTWMWFPQSLMVFTPLCDAFFFSMSGIWEFIISSTVDKSDTVYVIMFHKSVIPTFQKDALSG